jgi:hypothetical protein
MKDDFGSKGRDRTVIPARDMFARLRKQNQARAEARRYLETARRTALERQLVRRILNRERDGPDLHPVD